MRVRDPRLELRRGRPDRLPYFDVRGFPRLNGYQFILAEGWLLAIPPNTARQDFEEEIALILADARNEEEKTVCEETDETGFVSVIGEEEETHVE